jgi:hypothetical protein
MKSYAVVIGLYLGAFAACILLLVVGAIVLASDPVIWARGYWYATTTWSAACIVLLRVSRWLNRRAHTRVGPLQVVSGPGSITIADRATKRLVRQMACLSFVCVLGLAWVSWVVAPRYLQVGGEVQLEQNRAFQIGTPNVNKSTRM